MNIEYDEYTKSNAVEFIQNTLMYSKSNKLVGFKPIDTGYHDLRNHMIVKDRRNYMEVQ